MCIDADGHDPYVPLSISFQYLNTVTVSEQDVPMSPPPPSESNTHAQSRARCPVSPYKTSITCAVCQQGCKRCVNGDSLPQQTAAVISCDSDEWRCLRCQNLCSYCQMLPPPPRLRRPSMHSARVLEPKLSPIIPPVTPEFPRDDPLPPMAFCSLLSQVERHATPETIAPPPPPPPVPVVLLRSQSAARPLPQPLCADHLLPPPLLSTHRQPVPAGATAEGRAMCREVKINAGRVVIISDTVARERQTLTPRKTPPTNSSVQRYVAFPFDTSPVVKHNGHEYRLLSPVPPEIAAQFGGMRRIYECITPPRSSKKLFSASR